MSDEDKGTNTVTHDKGRPDFPHSFPSFRVLGDKVMFSELPTTYRLGKIV